MQATLDHRNVTTGHDHYSFLGAACTTNSTPSSSPTPWLLPLSITASSNSVLMIYWSFRQGLLVCRYGPLSPGLPKQARSPPAWARSESHPVESTLMSSHITLMTRHGIDLVRIALLGKIEICRDARPRALSRQAFQNKPDRRQHGPGVNRTHQKPSEPFHLCSRQIPQPRA